jgi:hypothetical protein
MSSKVREMKQHKKAGQIELTLGALLNSQAALSSLAGLRVPIQATFKLAKVAKAVNSELQTFEETRRGLCERLGKIRADKSEYEIPPENREEFEVEFKTLLDTPVELPGSPLRSAELGKVELSAADLLALEWLIVE